MTSLVCFISKFLDTDQLNDLARADEILVPHYLGCYPANINPDNIRKDCCWIWNTDESDKSGTHWIAVVKRDKKIIFFDSYGKTPTFFKRKYWLDYFQVVLKCRVSYYSTIQYQSYISRSCGAWCLLFLWEYWSGKKLFKQINNEDLIKNEQTLRAFVYEIFPKIITIYQTKCKKQKGQICKSFVQSFIK
jgi:hypothetical protein